MLKFLYDANHVEIIDDTHMEWGVVKWDGGMVSEIQVNLIGDKNTICYAYDSLFSFSFQDPFLQVNISFFYKDYLKL